MEVKYSIYKLTSLTTNKIYIGCTKDNVKSRMRYSQNHKCYYGRMREAVDKYGINDFVFEVLETCIDKEEAFKIERFYIEKYDATNPNIGYNTCKYKSGHSAKNTSRFKGHSHTEESKRKTSQSLLRRKLSDTTKMLISKNHYLRTPVKCVELNLNFKSLTEAERILKIDRHAIKHVLDTENTINNFHFVSIERGWFNEDNSISASS